MIIILYCDFVIFDYCALNLTKLLAKPKFDFLH